MSTNDLIIWLIQTGQYRLNAQGQIVGKRGILQNGKTQRYPKMEVTDAEGQTRHISKHQFIAVTLWGPIPERHTVNHKNGIKWDNRPNNLEVVTHQENIRHSYKNGLQGKRTHYAKLAPEQVDEIREAVGTCRALAAQYGVSHSMISAIKRGERRV